jgi:hypothetical protein
MSDESDIDYANEKTPVDSDAETKVDYAKDSD